ncbi:MAG TPA: exodeoxyribonuclease VII large subunit [Bryobacteraceae bacterium]|nr:exodeoxyribonuclease VII large subunit [Bryobacteraceae bacterium]
MEQFRLDLAPARKLFTVAELNARIRDLLDSEFSDIWVGGEISGTRLASSGHYYFTLKDGESQLRCACFRMTARYLKFKPQDGVAVVARGRIDVYEARGEYQLLVEFLEPQGYGALQFAFEQLKTRLLAEGLFDAARKRSIPRLPVRIGLVTSPSGAVVQDILNVLGRRFPGLHIRLFPALVQGEGSVEAVCRGLRYFSESGWAQVVIVARGGGSLEDLWTFNEEAVAREVAACSVPVVSAVGHETDFTIADFVADLRAPTPSAAAELVVCTRDQLLEQLASHGRSLNQAMRYRLNILGRRLHAQGIDRATSVLNRRIGRNLQRTDELERCLTDHVRRRIREASAVKTALDSRLRKMDLRLRLAEARRRLQRLDHDAASAMTLRLTRARSRLDPLAGELNQLSPLRVLDRGYAIVLNEQHVVKTPAEAPAGTDLRIRLAGGDLNATSR